ncbi:hypothetical protein [Alicyclobacillus tolerans]|uniref:Uncharacterized protein n=1 Tax=Alicyclobacillus tolerans TaxID=90970 RepID=A0A1M6TRQ0_9BACL|nr:hypothetical protein [Alicyclobacillus montanus]SHK59583.1 hypothetical protein SAMN05443507_11755 [Alicyclobacillus montanus]
MLDTSLVTNINRKKYYFSRYRLKEFLSDALEQGRGLRMELVKITACYDRKVDFTNTRETARFLNECILRENRIVGTALSNKLLLELFVETGDPFFQLLAEYRKCADRYKKVANVINTAIDPTFDPMNGESVREFIKESRAGVSTPIYPTFILNRAGQVSMVRPVLPFDREDVKKLFRFNVAIIKGIGVDGEDVTSELVRIKERYRSLMIQFDGDCYCMILGNTLYAKVDLDQFEAVVRNDIESETLRSVSLA